MGCPRGNPLSRNFHPDQFFTEDGGGRGGTDKGRFRAYLVTVKNGVEPASDLEMESVLERAEQQRGKCL